MECLELGRYNEFSQRIHDRAVKERQPITCTLELTRRCNLRCVHCYTNLDAGDTGARQAELTLQEYARLLDEIAEMGTLWMLVTGGEPLVRPDFAEIYQAAKRRGFLVTLFSNATLMTPQLADILGEWRPFNIEVTVYGATQATYEKVTGVPGSFKRCMTGLELLRERGLPFSLKCIAMSVNVEELPALAHLAESLGVSFRFDAMINGRIDGRAGPTEVRLTPEQVVELDRGDSRRMSEWREFCDRYVKAEVLAKSSGKLYSCGGGRTGFVIDPTGLMRLCVLDHSAGHDVRRYGVRSCWEGPLRNQRERKATGGTRCSTCLIRFLCGMCPPNSVLEGGEPEGPAEFLCRVAHLRAAALSIDVPEHGDCPYCQTRSRAG